MDTILENLSNHIYFTTGHRLDFKQKAMDMGIVIPADYRVPACELPSAFFC